MRWSEQEDERDRLIILGDGRFAYSNLRYRCAGPARKIGSGSEQPARVIPVAAQLCQPTRERRCSRHASPCVIANGIHDTREGRASSNVALMQIRWRAIERGTQQE
eukprot:605433-Rhodomonas_salina.1